jgi:RNA 3'-terminal phosphate cyclase-like protein
MIESARGILNPLTPDTYIFSDVSAAPFLASSSSSSSSSDQSARSRKKTGLGFGLSLVAESSTGCLYSADVTSPPEGGETPEDVGQQCAYQLLEIVSMSGTVSITAASTVLTLMAMGSEDVGRVQLGKRVLASEQIIGLARDLSQFGASHWGIRDATDSAGDEVIVSVVGRGVGNVGRKVA